MLRLQDIVKHYESGEFVVEALKGMNIRFRNNEFVSILGPSGCGKTTLLNIIGGLDRYTDGDLAINGKSTKHFDDSDWDAYRNHSVGFVFQSYNLIPHQTALVNVELALTLSGVSRSERRKRAIQVLNDVGLGDQLNKKPNQMSGGQMQRVAIARALINNPDILLADEPTGALDSETSTQVLDILKEVAKDRLVIMVTHNAELAETYSNRIVRLHDGNIISDSNPWEPDESETTVSETPPTSEKSTDKELQPSMTTGTALSLSFNNLLSKKARTLLTAFAGSIGIIGIALILSLSSGFQRYIGDVEQEMLASYPITIDRETIDAGSFMLHRPSRNRDARDQDAVYVNTDLTDSINMQVGQVRFNNIGPFKQFLEERQSDIAEHLTAMTYGYDTQFTVYLADMSEEIRQVHPSTLFDDLGLSALMEMNSAPPSMMAMMGVDAWTELIHEPAYLQSQYELVAGDWPTSIEDLALIVDSRNEISELALYALGLIDSQTAAENFQGLSARQQVTVEIKSLSYDEILDLHYKVVVAPDYFTYDETTGTWVDRRGDLEFVRELIDNGLELKVTSILRPIESTNVSAPGGAIGYSPDLIDYVIDTTYESAIVRQQLADPETNVFSGLPFGESVTAITGPAEGAGMLPGGGMFPGGSGFSGGGFPGGGLFSGGTFPGSGKSPDDSGALGFSMQDLSVEQWQRLSQLTPEEISALMAAFGLQDDFSTQVTVPADTFDEILALLGVVDRDNPTSLTLYTKDFHARAVMTDLITEYNQMQMAVGNDENIITYTDFIRLILSSVTSIINSISYVLIAFVAISLVVSSIMIGIFAYISVLERTKEIGILRSIGASKRDIARVFNAETLIVGSAAGALGVIVTMLLCIPINMIIESVSGIANVARLPASAAIVLVAISTLLTLVAGLIPARIASGKDPVIALRTE